MTFATLGSMRARAMAAMLAAGAALCVAPGRAVAEDIKLRIASGHPAVNTYVNLMQNFFVPEVTKRVAARTKHKVEFIEGYGGSMVKVADTLEGVQSGIIDVGGFCFCFEPSNLPLHAFQVMLPFGTMDPVISVKLARAVYDKVPFMGKAFEDKYNQILIGLIADNGYNLSTTFEWNTVADLKGRKLAGAGLNLKWLEYAGAVPVQSSLPEAYTSLQTGVYNGWIMFPSGVVNFKLHEVAKYLHRDRLRRDHLARPDRQQGALGQAAEGREGHHRRGRPRVRGAHRHGQPGELSQAARAAQGGRRHRAHSCRTACASTGPTRSRAGRRRRPTSSTRPACRHRRCSSSRSRRPRSSATSGRCATR